MLPKPPAHDSASPSASFSRPLPRSTNYAQELLPWFDDRPDAPPRSVSAAEQEDVKEFAAEPSTGRIPFLIY
jgi:hypothetical protein